MDRDRPDFLAELEKHVTGQEKFDLETLEKNKGLIVQSLADDPRRFSINVWRVKGGAFRKRLLESPYFNVDEEQLCCLLKPVSFDDIARYRNKVCIVASVTSLPYHGKQAEVKLVKNQNNRYVIKLSNLGDPQVNFSETPPTSFPNILKSANNQLLEACIYNLSPDKFYFGSDKFTNEALIAFIVDSYYRLMQKDGLNGYIRHFGATICGSDQKNRKGIHFMEWADKGDLETFIKRTEDKIDRPALAGKVHMILKRHIVVDILKQVICNLHWLQKNFNFSHNDLKARNILVSSEETAFMYQEIKHSSRLTFKIGDFGSSAFSLGAETGQTRLYNRNKAATAYLKVDSFKPKLNATKVGETYYTLGKQLNVQIFTNARHSGIPYYTSFDTYTFMISLLLIPEIFNVIMLDQVLRTKFWDDLWIDGDQLHANAQLLKLLNGGAKNSIQVIVSFLKGKKLKCNLTNILLENLKAL